MTLASFHLFSGIIASHTRDWCCFDALTIKGSSRWMLMAPCTLSDLSSKGVMNPLPRSIITKHAKIGVHALPCWILTRQHSPLAPCHCQVQDRIDDPSHVQCSWAPPWLCGGDQIFDTIPLMVGEIGWIQLVVFHIPSVPFPIPGRHPFSNRLLGIELPYGEHGHRWHG